MKKHESIAALTLAATVVVTVVVAVAVLAAPVLWAETPATHSPGHAGLGKNLFRSYCASCHGPEAKGDGPIAEYLRVAPPDLTQLAKSNEGEFPYDDVASKIDGREAVPVHGTDMPVWGDAFLKADEEGGEEVVARKITALVHFIWSVQE